MTTTPYREKWVSDCGTVTLYCGDCLKVLPTLEAGSVDAVVTDPPYGEQTHEGARTGKGDRKLVSFASITSETLLRVAVACVNAAKRWVVMTCEWRHAAELEKTGVLVRLGVWIKPNGAPQFTGDRPGTGWEAVACLHRSGRKRWNGGGHHAVWTCNKECGEHPTQKPLELIEKWVWQFTDKRETVFDPFMGSGTTGVACVRLGRRFIGIELEQKYFAIAKRRIIDELNRVKFLEPPKRERQKQLIETE